MTYYNEEYLSHHGIQGMKWGVRKYQNRDGSYTELGKRRYKETIAAKEEVNTKRKAYKKSKSSEALVNYGKAKKNYYNAQFKERGKEIATTKGDSYLGIALRTVNKQFGVSLISATLGTGLTMSTGNPKVAKNISTGARFVNDVILAKGVADAYSLHKYRSSDDYPKKSY